MPIPASLFQKSSSGGTTKNAPTDICGGICFPKVGYILASFH